MLTELSGVGGSACLTLATSIVLDAQRQEETTAWITSNNSNFFPLDVAAAGIDLEALAVVRVPDAPSVARAADRLARSGAFGLLVLDLGAHSTASKVTKFGTQARYSDSLSHRETRHCLVAGPSGFVAGRGTHPQVERRSLCLRTKGAEGQASKTGLGAYRDLLWP